MRVDCHPFEPRLNKPYVLNNHMMRWVAVCLISFCAASSATGSLNDDAKPPPASLPMPNVVRPKPKHGFWHDRSWMDVSIPLICASPRDECRTPIGREIDCSEFKNAAIRQCFRDEHWATNADLPMVFDKQETARKEPVAAADETTSTTLSLKQFQHEMVRSTPESQIQSDDKGVVQFEEIERIVQRSFNVLIADIRDHIASNGPCTAVSVNVCVKAAGCNVTLDIFHKDNVKWSVQRNVRRNNGKRACCNSFDCNPSISLNPKRLDQRISAYSSDCDRRASIQSDSSSKSTQESTSSGASLRLSENNNGDISATICRLCRTTIEPAACLSCAIVDIRDNGSICLSENSMRLSRDDQKEKLHDLNSHIYMPKVNHHGNDCSLRHCTSHFKQLLNTAGYSDQECVDTRQVMLECGHVFHARCVRLWIADVGNGECPACQYVF